MECSHGWHKEYDNLDTYQGSALEDQHIKAITTAREYLAAPEVEPVAWLEGNDIYWHNAPDINDWIRKNGQPLYTHPAPEAKQEPVAWRWSESGRVHWFNWTTDWFHHDKAKKLGFPIEYAYTTPEAKHPSQFSVNQQLLAALKIACAHMGMSELENSYPNDARIIAAAIKAADVYNYLNNFKGLSESS